MPSCLGLFVQNNLIKYAKVTKERDTKKIEAYGVKFFEGAVENAIKQIIDETFSYGTPVSINLSGENYNYFDMFALLNKKDMQKAIKTEFEAFCTDKQFNPNVFEKRYALVPNVEDQQKLKVIYVTENKIELNKRIQMVSGNKVSTVAPISMAISSLRKFEERQNAIIVNIEDFTTITTILDQKIYDIQQIPEGSQEILEKINLKENSYSKSYEMCKNTTIYTSEGRELQEFEMGHLEEIMPTLYSIVGQVKKLINEQTQKIERVYITGTAALINNIDLYFQEYLEDVKCEILKPDFVLDIKDISIKDYIEVNSAIAMGLIGLGEGIQGMNFKNRNVNDRLSEMLHIEVGGKKKKEGANSSKKSIIKFDLGEKLDVIEKNMLRGAYSLLMIFIVYSIFSILLNNQLTSKQDEVDQRISSMNQQIALAKADDLKLRQRTSDYTNLIQNVQELTDKASERLKTRNAIPNLLNQIMFIIPSNVQITSIQNTSDKHIEIYAQSNKYEQLGYLKAKIKSDNILTEVISTAGENQGNVVTVKIEGELP